VNVDQKPDELARSYRDRLAKVPDQIEDAQIGRQFSRYAEKLLRRFPGMLREAARQLRHGREGDQAVLRFWLPPAAAHNLVMGSELMLQEAAGGAAPPPAVAAKPPDGGGTSLAEKLKKPISLSFPRDTLERSVEMWAGEAGVKAVILGGDLQLDGITKNQQFDLDEKDQPAEAVLRKILLKASPQGKLVYVIKPETPGGAEIVFITTRAAAAKRNDKLPPGLEAAADGKPGKKA
jgi:hypothetical protein